MTRALGSAAAALAFALAPAAAGGERPAGHVTADEGKVEILSTPVKVGVRVDLPEGWYRVEEAGPEDGRVGSFAIVSANAFAASGAAPSAAEAAAEAPPQAPPAAAAKRAARTPCRAERNAYLRELLRARGVEIDDPEGVLAGLQGDGFAPDTATAWLALSGDALQPLAWTPELRAKAAALARCVRGR